jgi:hypothetical protein
VNRKYDLGRRSKNDGFDDYEPLAEEGEEFDEYYDEEEEEDEEVDFDNLTFRNDQMWNDYAEDLDYDE